MFVDEKVRWMSLDDVACDLVGGPEDGNSYSFPDWPEYLYFPYLVGELNDDVSFTSAPKLVYKRVVNRLYWFQGVID